MPVPIWPVLLFAMEAKVKNKIQGENLRQQKQNKQTKLFTTVHRVHILKKGTGTMVFSVLN